MSIHTKSLQDLSDQNDELENYFRNTIIPQLFVDANLILRKFTPPAMKQFDLLLSDVGKSIVEIHDNFRYPSLKENIQFVIDSNQILQKEIQTNDFRWYQMNIIPYIRREDNKTNGVIMTFVEITSRIKDLKEQEKLIADHESLLDILSHDIKNPLSTLKLAFGELKSMELKDQETFQMLLGIVERALIKMQDIIHDLTETREAEHKYKSSPELLNIEHILEDVRLALSEDIKSLDAEISWKIGVSELTFSRRKLRSIIYNLINNSIKYRSPDRTPKIFIETYLEDTYTVIAISDNGMGIHENDHSSVFDKYYRVENSVEGSGIGLHLVKELVARAGGKIELKSQLDKGTQIKIFLTA